MLLGNTTSGCKGLLLLEAQRSAAKYGGDGMIRNGEGASEIMTNQGLMVPVISAYLGAGASFGLVHHAA